MRVNPVCYNIPRVTAMSKPELTEAQNERIIAFGQRNRIRRLTWLYQPIRTGPDAGAAAMLIEFNPADVPSLSALAAMEEEIGGILDCKIDLHLYLREMYLGYGPGEHGIVYDRADHMDIPIPQEKIAEFCKRKKIRWLAKFPRPSRASVTQYADVDFLAGLAPDAKLVWGTLDGAEELNVILGCEVGLDLKFSEAIPPDLEIIYSDAASIQSTLAD